jgi:hypothetical protein
MRKVGSNTVLREDGNHVVIRPPLKTVGFWMVILILPSLLTAGVAWCCWVTAFVEAGWGWLALLAVLWLAGVLLLVWLSRGIDGATADSTGLTLEKAWQPSSRRHITWPDVRTLEITITPERRGVARYVVKLKVRDEQVERVVECPYDAALCREILSRAQLKLREAPENWRTAVAGSQDPFDAIKQLRGQKQRWVWARSD